MKAVVFTTRCGSGLGAVAWQCITVPVLVCYEHVDLSLVQLFCIGIRCSQEDMLRTELCQFVKVLDNSNQTPNPPLVLYGDKQHSN